MNAEPDFPQNDTPNHASPFTHVTVFGLGLIGGSFAMAIRQAYPSVHLTAVDPSAETLQAALKQKLVDAVSLQPPATFTQGSDNEQHLMVLASHLPVNLSLLRRLAPLVLGKPVTVIDLGSCKRNIVNEGAALLPQQFLGAHPMAGREVSGLKHALPLLFFGKRFLLCPHEQHPNPKLVEDLSTFSSALGMLPVVVDADTHDNMMAYVSHFPQLYSVMLTNLLAQHEPGKLLGFHGGGIDDQLRLAASPFAMWGPVFEENADNLEQVLGEAIDLLTHMKQSLQQPETMGKSFATSNQMYQVFQQLLQAKKASLACSKSALL